MHRITTLAVALSMTLAASGCIVVVGDKGEDDGVEAGWISSYDEKATARRDSNAELADRVSRRLDEVPALQAEDITVSASGEVVTLFGRLDDFTSLRQAVTAAGEVDGVSRVVSRITLDLRT
jgi:osmotically-inducible protein OsmY